MHHFICYFWVEAKLNMLMKYGEVLIDDALRRLVRSDSDAPRAVKHFNCIARTCSEVIAVAASASFLKFCILPVHIIKDGCVKYVCSALAFRYLYHLYPTITLRLPLLCSCQWMKPTRTSWIHSSPLNTIAFLFIPWNFLSNFLINLHNDELNKSRI